MHNTKEPVLLQPKFFTHIWGGELLKDKLDKNYPENNVGESWEVSAHKNGNSTITSGKHSGMAFSDYYKNVLGNEHGYPLLIKLIGPKRDLSVQVHPNDAYAKKNENSLGKKEAWYILSAPKGAQIVAGVNCGKAEFKKAVEEGNVKQTLNYIDCKQGETIAIDPGMVHALLSDVIVYEVQQNSDITYRIYDWDRVDAKTGQPRQLHVKQAFDVIDFDKQAEMIPQTEDTYKVLTDNEYFALIKINFDGEYIDKDNLSGAFTLVEGSAQIVKDNKVLFNVSKGDSFYAPCSNNFKILGKGEILKSIEK